MQLPDLSLLVLDTETTGFVPRTHRIIEFAAMKIQGGEMTKEYEQLLGIKGEVPPHIEVLTRIRTEDLAGKPVFSSIASTIEDMLSDDPIIVGQNIGFDIGMIKGEGLDLTDRPWIDTSMLASLVFPELESYSLGYVSSVLSLNHTPKHRALGDVRATTELLSTCWERLLELPKKERDLLISLSAKGPEGYKRFFAALPEPSSATKPQWLTALPHPSASKKNTTVELPAPHVKEISLLEEPLEASFLSDVLASSAKKKDGVRHWVSVKNLEAAIHRTGIPEGVSVLVPPYLLIDPAHQERFLAQQEFTADELTLAIKLHLYKPVKQADMPIHGDERHVFEGKLAAKWGSDAYLSQELTDVILLDHRSLLKHLHEEEFARTGTHHMIIDDASMLEDTATKAWGWYVNVSSLRAASIGDDKLTKFTDLLQLWIEKTRSGTDLRYIVGSDLQSREAEGLRTQLADLHIEHEPVASMREHLSAILNPDNLGGRIVYIEVYMDGGQYLNSVPLDIATELKNALYDRFPTTLLIPPQSDKNLHAILPHGTQTHVTKQLSLASSVAVCFPDDCDLEKRIESCEGKTIILVSGKRTIEDMYIKYAEDLEKKNVTLLCQGLSGGQGRMQAEFLAAPAPVLMLMTPWMYEGLDLPPNSVDHLVIHALPFDHPSHAVISRRSERFQNAFIEYSFPRLLHRLFRLLRTFARHTQPSGDVCVTDTRIATRDYGKDIKGYLEQFSRKGSTIKEEKAVPSESIEKPKSAKRKSVKKKGDGLEQQTLF
jgi:DNA polymerase III epsilon subunit-like protein